MELLVMDSYGDNISPFEDGNNVYSCWMQNIYGSLGYTIADVELGEFIWWKQNMMQLIIKKKRIKTYRWYSFTESLAFILYVDVKCWWKWCWCWLKKLASDYKFHFRIQFRS